MSIIASAGSGGTDFPTHPEGQYTATCIDVIDYGLQTMTWQGVSKEKHRIGVRFYCGEDFTDDEGKRRPLWVTKSFTLSLHEKSALRPFLQAWRGKAFTNEELAGFDVEKLIGAPALLQVAHNPTEERTYANIDSVMKLPKGMEAPAAPAGYVRAKDRHEDDDEDSPEPVGASSHKDDSLPF